MITTTGTTNSEAQLIRLLSLPELCLSGPRLREEHHTLRYPLEDRYWSLETSSLQNQDDRRSWNHTGVDHSQCWVMTILHRITQWRWTPGCTTGEKQYSTAVWSNLTEKTMMNDSQDEPISNQCQSWSTKNLNGKLRPTCITENAMDKTSS